MLFQDTPIAGVHIIEMQPFEDHRGRFARLFCQKELSEIGFQGTIVQINHSMTVQSHTLRGMHYQTPPFGEDKIVQCLKGEVYDVAVDLRAGSDTFLKWFGTRLSPGNRKAIFLPKGTAHGFQTLAPDTELLYFHSQYYSPEHEAGIRFDDPELGIEWPYPVKGLSDRDKNLPRLSQEFKGLEG